MNPQLPKGGMAQGRRRPRLWGHRWFARASRPVSILGSAISAVARQTVALLNNTNALERFLITVQIVAIPTALIMGVWLTDKWQRAWQLRSTQSEILAKLFEIEENRPRSVQGPAANPSSSALRSESDRVDATVPVERVQDELALLATLGQPGFQFLIRRLQMYAHSGMLPEALPEDVANADTVDGALSRAQAAAIQRFRDISFALHGYGTVEDLADLYQIIRQHPDPRVRRACLRTFQVVPRLEARPFLEEILQDDGQTEETRLEALLALQAVLKHSGQPVHVNGVNLRDQQMLRGRTLNDISIRDSRLSNLNLTGTQLRGTSWNRVHLEVVDMALSDWSSFPVDNSASLPRTSLLLQRFGRRPPLRLTQLRDVDLLLRGGMTGAQFHSTTLDRVGIRGASGDSTSDRWSGLVDFLGASLTDSVIVDLRFQELFMGQATLSRVQFSHNTIRNLLFDSASRLDEVCFAGNTIGTLDLSSVRDVVAEINHGTVNAVSTSNATGLLYLGGALYDRLVTSLRADSPGLDIRKLAPQESHYCKPNE